MIPIGNSQVFQVNAQVAENSISYRALRQVAADLAIAYLLGRLYLYWHSSVSHSGCWILDIRPFGKLRASCWRLDVIKIMNSAWSRLHLVSYKGIDTFDFSNNLHLNNHFTELYKTYSNPKLLEIIENGKDYQPIALEAAKTELESRKLTEAEITEAKQVLSAKQQEAEEKREASLVFQKRVQEVSVKVAHELNPTTQKSHEFVIKLICIYLGLELLWTLYDRFSLIKFILFSPQSHWDPFSILFFVPFIYVPIAIYFLWKKTSIGWTLYVIMLSLGLSLGLISFFRSFYIDETLGGLFPSRSFTSYVMPVFLYSGQLIYINTQPLKEIFTVSIKRQAASFGIPILLALILWLS